MSPFELIRSLFAKTELPKKERERCEKLISSHLSDLGKYCERAVSQRMNNPNYFEINGFSQITSPFDTIPENAKDELLGFVLDHLRKNDFKVVRDYRGDATFKTYLASIVSTMVVDGVRSREGRSRVRERAEMLGGLCKKLYGLVYEKGWSPHEAQNCLEIEYGIHVDIDQIHECLEKMRGRDKKIGNILWSESGFVAISDEGFSELVVPDFESNPEKRYAERESSILAAEVVSELFETLNGEEKLILRMRFPPDNDEAPKTFREIADFVGISEDKAGRIIERILREFREKMMSKGISLHDLI